MNRYVVFNSMLMQLLDYLQTNFPEYAAEITVAKNSISVVKMGDITWVAKNFQKVMGPYAEQLRNFDESFFLGLDLPGPEGEMVESLQIKKIWTSGTVTDTHKATIFFYVNKLLDYSS